MLSIELARDLRRAGLSWAPVAGDRFMVPDRDMDDDVFVVSDMAIEVRDLPGGQVLGFNGTTEWALDSVERDTVLWLPREEQLRGLLGERFRSLVRDDGGWTVQVTAGRRLVAFTDRDVECAYAMAVLSPDDD